MTSTPTTTANAASSGPRTASQNTVSVTRPSRQHQQPSARVVMLHGRGADETSLAPLSDLLPARLEVTALRAPISEGAGFAWFANRGVGRPLPDSLARSMAWVRAWLDDPDAARARHLPTYLLGFSGGMAMAGALLLGDPGRFAGAALLAGTLPFDAGLPTSPARLTGLPVFYGHGRADRVIPGDLAARTRDYLLGSSAAEITEWGYDGLGHEISAEMAADVAQWFDAHTPGRELPAAGDPPLALPPRPGLRPRVWQGIPQAQLDQQSPPRLRAELLEHAQSLAQVTLGPSRISVPGATGLLLAAGARRGPRRSFIVPSAGEFAHVHPGEDGSLHLVLPPAQVREIHQQGWGLAHPFAGGRLSPDMVPLYAPRDNQELRIAASLLSLSRAYASTPPEPGAEAAAR